MKTPILELIKWVINLVLIILLLVVLSPLLKLINFIF
jgi:hypothetical protein